MKKWCVVILFVVSLFLFERKEELEPVFEVVDSNDYIVETIDVSNTSFTTLTITSLLDSISLHRVVIEIPKLYQNKLGEKSTFMFHTSSNKQGLSNIEKTIQNQLKELGGLKEAEKISFYGVKLDSIEVYGRVHDIETLKQKLKNY